VIAQLPDTGKITTDPDLETSTLEVRLSEHGEGSEPLLSIQLDGNDTFTAIEVLAKTKALFGLLPTFSNLSHTRTLSLCFSLKDGCR
jgi:hypothetical protein